METQNEGKRAKKVVVIFAFLKLVLCFSIALTGLVFLLSLTPLTREADKNVWLSSLPPASFRDIHRLASALKSISRNNPILCRVQFCAAYLFLQSFCIPGSVFLSILGGALFGFYQAFPMVIVLAATGASGAFTLSRLVFKDGLEFMFPERFEKMRRKVEEHRKHLINYILFVRVTPFMPNWFVNLAAPTVGVPLAPFFIGTMIGIIPNTLVAVNFGLALHEIADLSTASPASLFSPSLTLVLLLFGLLVLLPTFSPVQRWIDRVLLRRPPAPVSGAVPVLDSHPKQS